MSAALRVSTVVMLGAGGLFTGGVVWYAWERVWIWRRLTLRAYAVDFRRSLRKADPALPILLVICAARERSPRSPAAPGECSLRRASASSR
jgi:hypothetical protein